MSDPKVLEAQKWVNTTYRNAPGYLPCTENGNTGWETVDCLTQALQHELGISPTVKSFGPGTFEAVKNRGRMPGSEQNRNIVAIYNHALWCKGYFADEGSTWGLVSANSLARLIGDMSVPTPLDNDMWARVTRSLFRMDQFKLVSSGSPDTRATQAMLNSRYVAFHRIPAMNLVPCDGVYSRDVQQGLMMAIQFELGLDKSTINGYFGPGTQAALKTHPIRQGSIGPLVQLFLAACFFNSPTYEGTSPREFPPTEILRTSFDGDSADWLRAFQRFSQLPDTGMGDFATWAQLLVSSGDTSRNAQGCDCITEITLERGRTLYDNGYRIVGRYIDEELPPDDPYYLGKALKPGELQAIFAAGLRMYPLFQYNGTQLGNFTYPKGVAQGEKAHHKAIEHGFAPGTCIYFAVDYDAMDSEIDANVIPYFAGVRAALTRLGSRYQFGVYGPRNVCDRVSREAGARWSFVSGMSWGYSGNLGYPLPINWSFNQIREYEFQPGWGLDHNIWRMRSDPGVGPSNGDNRYNDIVALVEFVQAIEKTYDEFDEFASPGVRVRKTAQGRREYTLDFFRHEKYNHGQWLVLIGLVDAAFVRYAEDNKGLVLEEPFTYPNDPTTHRALDMQHTMAACQGHLQYYETGDGVDVGDGSGWLGDLITFYAQWRNSYSHLNGYEFCRRYLGNPLSHSAYGEDDWKADADAFNLATLLTNDPELPVSAALRRYYLTPAPLARRRFTLFRENRFAGSPATVEQRAEAALTEISWNLMTAGLVILLRDLPTEQLPWNLDPELLRGFIASFGDKLSTAANEEPTS